MPLDLTFFPHWNLVHVDYFGCATVGNIVRSYSDMMSHPEAGRLRYAINDLRSLENLNVFYEGMSHMARTISADAALRPAPWEIAIVSTQRGMTRILTDYCAQVSRAGTARCGLFSDIPAAVDWLGVSRDVMDLSVTDGRLIMDARPSDRRPTA
ncbi:hypothetical protein [Antarctobacter heliothermus]|uniref:SpoIIAA-like n=1 Tax=Antarctobacter heliothermus TaxID=74033 RepID=A0A239I9F3_9RHOB|nr:hypothetical protein [Antarctobacter heliothermus]SNS90456.1 hypothetical protein SAMN04488078_10415 [Antarctobacter heliothermus]